MSICEASEAGRRESTVRPSFQTGLVSLIESAHAWLRRRAELRQNRRAFLNIAALDDRALDDIGLTRFDVETAANLPLEINASLAVRQFAAERRAVEHRMRRR
jgi:uncharacterized protein YjiS (DUF1127 family)